MNPSKTEFIIFGSRQQLKKVTSNSLTVVDDEIQRSKCIKYLGEPLDESLSFADHVNSKCRIASWNLQKIKRLRQYMDTQTCKTVIQSLVMSHLDYGNCLLVNVPKKQLNKLQRVQNRAAKLVLNRSRYESSKKARFDLHWLPIHERIEFKILTIVFKCLNGSGPNYLTNLFIRDDEGLRSLRSRADNCKLKVPFVQRKTFAERAISVAGPKPKIRDALQ